MALIFKVFQAKASCEAGLAWDRPAYVNNTHESDKVSRDNMVDTWCSEDAGSLRPSGLSAAAEILFVLVRNWCERHPQAARGQETATMDVYQGRSPLQLATKSQKKATRRWPEALKKAVPDRSGMFMQI
ncbi:MULTISPECIES: hypothetical protein [Comamonas]|jgi:hypothetical protein|uniref:Uncharacterized protein n=1 Tax=Comamonas squillarum TaxID=2977320 RepID=A0ABY5ZZ30_9BURK|nr:hypothetical protein [Comamonas sp. PR12]UXC19183.1 hypothetical protein N4T19_03380 [Comamonas sp. PR12]